ncbi:hypothetical protein EBB07_23895 [Paenibacillaceae bacterium]|nr:hypothetical protein EBB07_23895 [Paenibacillaceae bacterium]
MEYQSILFDQHCSRPTSDESPLPVFLHDIHMDQIIQEIVKGKEACELEPLFYTKLEHMESIRYRSAIMEEIDHVVSVEALASFSQRMGRTREYVQYSHTSPDHEQRMKWLLDAASLYCQAIIELHRAMTAAQVQSHGLKRFYAWLNDYVHTSSFTSLHIETTELHEEFSQIQFNMTIADGKIKVSATDDDQDYCKLLSRVLLQGRGAEEEDFAIRLSAGLQLSDIEKGLLSVVRKHYPAPFRKLPKYYQKHLDFIDDSIMTFDRELQFCLACLQYFHSLKHKGLTYSYPSITASRELHIKGGYDLSLASSALHGGQPVVGNHFDLTAAERICVLTGPNQGGKTTFARSLGQILHLSSIGCPVPCQEAVIFEFDRIFTHFPSQELPGTHSGKLEDELLRLKPIVDAATDRSVIILNELFFTTTTHDAYAMGSKALRLFMQRGAMCLYVTHVFELAAAHERIVSLVAVTNEFDPAKRTFRIRRQPADGIVHASSIVKKYDLTRQRIKERIQ